MEDGGRAEAVSGSLLALIVAALLGLSLFTAPLKFMLLGTLENEGYSLRKYQVLLGEFTKTFGETHRDKGYALLSAGGAACNYLYLNSPPWMKGRLGLEFDKNLSVSRAVENGKEMRRGLKTAPYDMVVTERFNRDAPVDDLDAAGTLPGYSIRKVFENLRFRIYEVRKTPGCAAGPEGP
jgi:hypothetical protein